MIRLATAEDARTVHQVMLSAFEEYRHLEVPSSALNETVSSLEESLRSGSEQALLYYAGGVPAGSVRFKTAENSLYFSRLSVVPAFRNRGIAKSLLAWLEDYARKQRLAEVWCRVRMSVPKNIRLYESVGYNVCKEEVVINADGRPVKTVVMKKEVDS